MEALFGLAIVRNQDLFLENYALPSLCLKVTNASVSEFYVGKTWKSPLAKVAKNHNGL